MKKVRKRALARYRMPKEGLNCHHVDDTRFNAVSSFSLLLFLSMFDCLFCFVFEQRIEVHSDYSLKYRST